MISGLPNADDGRRYWHIRLQQDGEKLWLDRRKGKGRQAMSEFLLRGGALSRHGGRTAERDGSMKKRTKRSADRDTMRTEYDFRGGVRGKYVSRYRAGTNVVVLDPDVAAAFPNARAVNRALRALLDVVPVRRAKRRSA